MNEAEDAAESEGMPPLVNEFEINDRVKYSQSFLLRGTNLIKWIKPFFISEKDRGIICGPMRYDGCYLVKFDRMDSVSLAHKTNIVPALNG